MYLIVLFRDPGTTEIGEKIREILLNPELELNKWTEFNLFLAARAQLVHEFLIPTLEKSKIVFLDRYYDSTIAYQGFRNGIPLETIINYNKIMGAVEPDLTLLYKISVEEAQSRLRKNSSSLTRIDQEALELHKKVAEGYDFVAQNYKERVYVIDASRSLEEVTKETIKIIGGFLANVLNPD